MRFAVIENGRVVNIVEASTGFAEVKGWIAAENGVQINDLYVDGLFSSPDIVIDVPQIISRFQAKAALLNAGLLAQFEALMINPLTPEIIRLAWVESSEFHRNSPSVVSMTQEAGLTSGQLDDLFRAAALIVV